VWETCATGSPPKQRILLIRKANLAPVPAGQILHGLQLPSMDSSEGNEVGDLKSILDTKADREPGRDFNRALSR
jgi:hypothetical protein